MGFTSLRLKVMFEDMTASLDRLEPSDVSVCIVLGGIIR